MGKIMINGINYSGSAEAAENIEYNNSTSGLAATTIQGAIDELTILFDNNAYDMQVIFDALTNLGVEVPEDATADEVASLISASLKKYASSSSISLSLSKTYSEPNSLLIPFTSVSSSSGDAFSLESTSNGILVNYDISSVSIVATAYGRNVESSNVAASTNVVKPTLKIYVNNVEVGSKKWSVAGSDVGWVKGSLTLTQALNAGDVITLYATCTGSSVNTEQMKSFTLSATTIDV